MNASEAKKIEIISGKEYPGKSGAILVPRMVDNNKKTVLYTNSITNDLHEVSLELFQKLVRLPEEKEPAPKEGEKTASCSKCGNPVSHKWFHSSASIELDHEVVFEPAKPESGDGLLNEVKGHYHTLKFLNDALLATKDSQQSHAYRIAEVATDQIKSALKENERLRGLLRDCTDFVDRDPKLSRLIKAAVTGAKP